MAYEHHQQALAALIYSIASQVQTVPDDAQRNQMLNTLRTAGSFLNVAADHHRKGLFNTAHNAMVSTAHNIGIAGKLLAAHGLKNSNFLYADDTANDIVHRYSQKIQGN